MQLARNKPTLRGQKKLKQERKDKVYRGSKIEKRTEKGRVSVRERVKLTNIENKRVSIMLGADKEGRTRAGKEAQKKLRKFDRKLETKGIIITPNNDNTPPKKVNGKNIYQAKGRSFTKEFSENWWAEQEEPWTCAICNEEIAENGKGGAAPSIDHKKSWAEQKLEVKTFMVCKGGWHWEVAYSKDVRAIIEDESNLRPAHKRCNSSKSGSRNTDNINPQKRKKCPGDDDCECPKAQ